MKTLIVSFLLCFTLLLLFGYYDSTIDPYEEGMHMDYSIKCENGFVIKILESKEGAIQVLNSDGTPLKCGKKIY